MVAQAITGGGPTPWSAGFNFRSTSGFVTPDPANTRYWISSTIQSYPTAVTMITSGTIVNAGYDDDATCSNTPSVADVSNSIDFRIAGEHYTTGNAVSCNYFKVQLPSSGVYKVSIGAGQNNSNLNITLAIYDGGGAITDVVSTDNGSQTGCAGTNTVKFTSGRAFQPDWVGGTVTIALTPYTVATYVSGTCITLSSAPGTQVGATLTYGSTSLLATVATNQATTAGQFVDANGNVRTSAANWASAQTYQTLTFASNIMRVKIGPSATGFTAIDHIGVTNGTTPP